MPKDEFEWIRQHTPQRHFQKNLLEGIGDDAAVFASEMEYNQLLCVDTMIENIHFKKKTMRPEDIGYKALAVNLSDIAAMGGIPVFYMVSIAVPASWSDDELKGIYNGMTDLGAFYQMDLIGGDTVSSPHELMISVTVYGKVEHNALLLRGNAKPGDYVFLTSATGRSAAGLQILLNKGRLSDFNEKEKVLINHHQRPKPKIIAGRTALKLQTRIALNDISDGLASETFEIAEASGTSIELFKDQIPVAEELLLFSEDKYWQWILYGGEDFEIVGTVSERDWLQFQDAMKRNGIELYKIGRVKEGCPSVTLIDGEKKESLQKQGYNHFR
ncbi:thiamine-phosphate kinase [Alteribacillus sp. YIM 98480]|uniref:thiamine-phosphate kinase n=1 Tax=Alteribacillus sp. YIM 98480 TaxID=2606599 RepID=UPI00131B1C6D|nr:thiamine-phosphate kinase [Alteribacillus sp. YIM 98480]